MRRSAFNAVMQPGATNGKNGPSRWREDSAIQRMSSDYNISYSFSIGGTGPATPPVDDQLYAFGDCEECNLGNGAVLLVSRTQAAQAVVSRDVAIALDHCREFRSLQAHAQYLAGYMPELGGDAAGVRSVLEHVRDSGLFESAATYATALGSPAGSDSPPPSRVFIISCDRPQAVERLLDSMLAGAELTRHEALFLIDDSRDSASAARNRELVESFNLKSPRDMHYFGLPEREALVSTLAARLPQHAQSLHFLLDRSRWAGHATYGLARTLCLLLSVGKRALVMDDDILCRGFDAPYRRRGLSFREDICEVDFYPSANSWSQQLQAREEDPLRSHLQCLGLGVGEALQRLDLHALAATDLDTSQEKILRGLSAASPVLITQNGTLGDPGTGDTSWAYNLSGDSLARLLAEPGSVAEKLATRQYWMGWSQATFARRANMSQLTGLDNSALLPPYFPAWRGEDMLFGALTHYLHPDSVVLNYPFAVPHLPLQERTGNTSGDPAAANGVSLIDGYLAQQLPQHAGSTPESRLESLVLLFRDAAQSSDLRLAGAYRSTLGGAQADSLRQLGDALRGAGNKHAEWRAILEERQRKYLAAIGRNAVPVRLAGVPPDTSEEQLWQQFRSLAAGFADALAAWPEIRRAAAEADPQSTQTTAA